MELEITINGKTLKKGSVVTSDKAPRYNILIRSVYQHPITKKISLICMIGCCRRIHLEVEDVKEVVTE